MLHIHRVFTLSYGYHTACLTGRCSSWEYECSNGRCIDESINCNDNNPCGDYSDCEDNDFTFTLDGEYGPVGFEYPSSETPF